jgi:predicted AAA+ superfamily ATPase
MFIKRTIEPIILNAAQVYPTITVTGPRQSGKTTLIRYLFPDKPYVSLEAPDIQLAAISDPRSFLAQFPDGVILDEVQRAPQLLSYVQGIVDELKRPGQFILSGSQNFALIESITQSLAGRTAIFKLLPLTLSELESAGIQLSDSELLHRGFFPAIHADHRDPVLAYRSYYETYIERDLRQLIHLKDLSQFQKFVRLCASRIGQTVNASHFANDIGVSVPTISNWLSLLQASYIIFLLPPFFQNMKKRLIKSPKLYFYDVGLASFLLDIETPTQIARDPFRGMLIENLVVMDLVKIRYNAGRDHHLYFYRDTGNHEVDIVYKSGQSLTAIEVKSSATFHTDFLKGLRYFRATLPDQVVGGGVVYTGESLHTIDGWNILNVYQAGQLLIS